MKKSPELLRHLERKHRNLDAALSLLMKQPRLTPQEHLRARELKKRKLLAKDAIAALRSTKSVRTGP